MTQKDIRILYWGALAALLAAVVAGAFLISRSTWSGREPFLASGEATVLMQAASLAYDFDLAYTRDDFERLTLEWRGEPPDLELASGSGGRRITYHRAFPYALYLAPFVRLAPRNGFAVANALLLACVAVFAARGLRRQLGDQAPLWVAVLVFGSVTWAYALRASGDLFLWAAAVLAWGAVARVEMDATTAGKSAWRASFAAGALLALPLMSDVLHVVLVAAAFFALPRRSRHRGLRSAYLLGLSIALVILVGAQWWASGGLHFLATTHFRFTPETGFPLVDFSAQDWTPTLRHLQALYWEEAPRFSWGVDPFLWLWDAVYLFFGRNIGLLPYFLPAVALFIGSSYVGFRRMLVVAAGIWAAAILVVHPFNLYGGEGAIGNRLFLPLYGALFFLPDEAARRPLRPVWALVVAAASALFLLPLWSAPGASPVREGGGYRHVGPVAAAALPFETSQRWIPGGATVDYRNLRIRFLTEDAWGETRRDRLRLERDKPVEMVIASGVPLRRFFLDFGPDASSLIELHGAEMGEIQLLPSGGFSVELLPGAAERRHRMWWTPERQWLYCLSLRVPSANGAKGPALAFELTGEPAR